MTNGENTHPQAQPWRYRHGGHEISLACVLSAPPTPDRPTVMFFSGFRSDKNGTKALALEAHCRARGYGYLRFDYSGHGESSGDFEHLAVGDWLRDSLELIDHLTHGPLVLAGSSLGGWLALLAAMARPARVRALLGIACAPDFTQRLLWNAFSPPQQHELLTKGRVLIPDCYGGEPYPITRHLIEASRPCLLLNRPNLPIDCPVHLLHGLRDADVPPDDSLAVARLLTSPDTQVTLLKQADHRMSSPEALAAITQALDGLVAKI